LEISIADTLLILKLISTLFTFQSLFPPISHHNEELSLPVNLESVL
jgi:hypothetical protein